MHCITKVRELVSDNKKLCLVLATFIGTGMKLQALTIPLCIAYCFDMATMIRCFLLRSYFFSSTEGAETVPVEAEVTPFIIIIMASAASEPWLATLWMGALTGPFLPARPLVETGKLALGAGAAARCSVSSRRSMAGC